ncbi:MAG: hypothetical protein MUO38_00980 [Anaerolineales bacterium]|jgi:hypothetical protein|nr:hypothetical protein [Anaerolineales bacterium]
MSDQPGRELIPSGSGGVFRDLALRLRLILRLMGDRRVSPFVKLLPIGSVVYLFLPDLVPGPIDDAAMIWLLAYLFVELSPAEVVAEHMRDLTSVVEGEWREIEEPEKAETQEPE